MNIARSESAHFEIKGSEQHRFSRKDGKIDGLYEVIHEDGSITKSMYVYGIKHGPENIAKDGRVIMQGYYKDGRKHGLFWTEEKITYYVLGHVATKEEYLSYEN